VADDFANLVTSLREVLDSVRLSDPPPEVAREQTDLLSQVSAAARANPGTIGTEPVSRRPDLPGRGNAIIPGFVMHDDQPARSYGRGSFSAAHLGRAAVHGGSITLIFDEVIGRLIERDGKQARTAYLHINYRNLVPVDVELDLEAQIDRQEGRKTFASATIRLDDLVLADAEGLWISPRQE
jgi:hypothetical protein